MAGLVYPISYKVDSSGLKQAQSSFSDFGATFKKALGAAAIAATVMEIGKVLNDAGKAASADAKSQALLATQLKTTTGATQGQIASVESAISKMSMMAGVADDDIRPAFAQLVRATGDVGKAQTLTNTALDIAAAKGVSVSAAATALGKAAQGNTGALAKMGIAVKGVADPLAAAQAQFNGAAEAAGNANPYQRLTTIFDEIKESLGRTILPLVKQFADFLQAHAGDIAAYFGKLGDIFSGLSPIVSKLFDVLMKLANTLGSALLKVMPAIIDIFNALIPVLDPVVSIISALVSAVLPPLVAIIEKVLVPVLQILVDIINQYLVPYLTTLASALGDVLTQAVGVVIELFDQLKITIDPIVQAFKDFQAATGIDFTKMMLTMNPAILTLQSLARGLAVVIFAMKMARAVMTKDWGAVAKLTAEGPYAAMDKAAAESKAAANAARGADAYASRYSGMEAMGQALSLGVKPVTTPVVLTPVVQGTKVLTAAQKAAAAAAKAHAKAVAEAAAAAKKLYDDALQAYNDLAAAGDKFKVSFASVVASFKNLAKTETSIGQFEGQVVDNFKNITDAAQQAFDNKLITQTALNELTAYASKEQAILAGIGRQRDELANKISLAQSLYSATKDSITSFGNITGLLKDQANTVQQTTTQIINGVSTTITKTVELANAGDLVAEYKKIIDKTKAFATNLKALKAAGLDSNLFKQIVDAGVDAGGATAAAIIAGGGSTVTELNSLFADLQKTGSDVAEATTVVMYNNGQDVVGGFIQGLQSQESLLAATATSMATTFADTFTGLINSAMNATLNMAANQVNSAAKGVTVDAASMDTYALAKQLAGNAADYYSSSESIRFARIAQQNNIQVAAPQVVVQVGGKEIVSAIKTYERANGSVWVSA